MYLIIVQFEKSLGLSVRRETPNSMTSRARLGQVKSDKIIFYNYDS
jgi:hypothetical protein